MGVKVWNQVKVKSGDYADKAGVVQWVDDKKGTATVKLDELADPVVIKQTDLEVLC